MATACFHCGEDVPASLSLQVTINGIEQPMCCIGCQAVAQTIVDNNLTQYYQVRTETAVKGSSLIPEQLKKHQLLDDDSLQDEFIHKTAHHKEAILTIEGISCAACAWLIEMQIAKLAGISKISVNATTQRATVKWQDKQLKLSDILYAIENIGYHALPFKASDIEERNKKQNKAFIKRLGISGILMMQVMMIAFGLYFGAFSDMAEHNKVYLRWASLVLTLPVVFYGALPFYTGAINALKMKRLSMDVPVSIAITLAFSASAWATVTEQGEVYFESVSMFTFLLLIGKYLEFRARSRAAEISANLLKLMPMTATLLSSNDSSDDSANQEKIVAAKNLQLSDKILIKPGEIVPADGVIISGSSQLNEAMLSGEQLPLSKTVNDTVFAGTINGDGNLTVEVKRASTHTFLSQLIRLSEQSQAHKPKLAQLSDKIAQYFVAIILFTAIGTAIYWQQHLPEEAFWITLSVLVATCPCALSLATPTALTCATTRLNRDGILIKSAHVMETIPKIECYAFDKTGTLTTGEFTIDRTLISKNNNYSDNETDILAIAAALESHSEHPLAKPFALYRDYSIQPTDINVHAGLGISGNIAFKNTAKTFFQIGKPSWLLTHQLFSKEIITTHQEAQCVLIANNEVIASFYLIDKIRDDAKALITALNAEGSTIMLSGDSQLACDNLAKTLPITNAYGNLSATDKMNRIKQQQQKMVMVGDGVNDTPVFGAAHVSIAMGSGTDIAKNGADVILLNNHLSSITTLAKVAKKTRTVIIENYLWAFGYNAIILPLAVSGFITPYMAVIGMSASSILVITNSLRLLKK